MIYQKKTNLFFVLLMQFLCYKLSNASLELLGKCIIDEFDDRMLFRRSTESERIDAIYASERLADYAIHDATCQEVIAEYHDRFDMYISCGHSYLC